MQTAPRTRATLAVRRLRAEQLRDGRVSAQVEREETLTIGSAAVNDLVIDERTVSRYHVELRRTGKGIELQDLGSTNGVYVGALRVARGIVAPGTLLRLGSAEVRVLDAGIADLALRAHLPDAVAEVPAMRALFARADRAAQSGLPVLVTGESGSGKEVVARAVHRLGPRCDQPFVVVDCGAIPAHLLASELFGHERGAFTGARERRVGAFESAGEGTVFLDEIAELTPQAAQLLVGVLTRGEFQRVGGDVSLASKARVVAATHRDLRSLANRGDFRSDLYERLAVIRIEVPPLRERADEIPALVDLILRQAGIEAARHELVSPATLDAWVRAPWPGNVRELRHAVLSVAMLGEQEPPDSIPTGPFAAWLELPYREARDAVAARFEREYLAQLLEGARQNVSEAARHAQLDRSHLHTLLRRHALR